MNRVVKIAAVACAALICVWFLRVEKSVDVVELDDGEPPIARRNEDYVPLEKGGEAWRVLRQGPELLFKPSLSPLNVTELDLKLSHSNKTFESGIHLLTSFYRGGYSKERLSEIVAVLVSNLQNPYIDVVHVLYEGKSPTILLRRAGLSEEFLEQKLVLKFVTKQPTYSGFFRYANAHLERGAVAMLSNADIYFDHTLVCLLSSTSEHWQSYENKTVLALSRRHSKTSVCKGVSNDRPDHGKHFDLCLEYVHSHDTFVFRPPLSEKIFSKTTHVQNLYGAENLTIWSFLELGYVVMNPCRKINGFHLHCRPERHYSRSKFVDGLNDPTKKTRHGVARPGTLQTGTDREAYQKKVGFKCAL